MLYWSNYKSHNFEIIGKRKKFDNTIYTFDIETTSYLLLYGKIIPSINYIDLTDKEKDDSIKMSCMYIWQFGINNQVYYGRTWQELKLFLDKLENNVPYRKYIYVHNLSFEFQYLKSYFSFDEVTARKKHKVMTALMSDYNIMFKCSYMLSNCALEYLPKLFNLPVEKLVGSLDYTKIRHASTLLTDDELKYCEYDCLVLYEYIKFELCTYETIKNIPTTSTGKVRRELKNLVLTDYHYKRLVYKSININPHIYNLLIDAFAGGYTHANWIYTDEILKDIDSYDFTSSYPYIMVTHKFPMSEFKKCYIKDVKDMNRRICYLLVVKLYDVKCKYFNNFISLSKCRNVRGGKYDNGRIISCDYLEITLTDIDFYFILDTYKCRYEITEIYYANYNYLPKQFINFILDKYINKTKFKDVDGKEIEYQKEKNKFNSLYGMSVTNMIRDNVIFDDNTKTWYEEELTNDEIIEKLNHEKKTCFLSFAWGVWVTSYARNNLLRNVIKLDEHAVYMDTDSIKLLPDYNIDVINNYNKFVENKISFVSNYLKIDIERFAPKDIHGKSHMLGIFEKDAHYDEFITQGAKKYAYKKDGKIKITVAGVPKKGATSLNTLDDFRDDYVFKFEDTNKNTLMYIDNMSPIELTDYLGVKLKVTDISGCCLLPATYVLAKSEEYANLIYDDSSKRAIYRE